MFSSFEAVDGILRQFLQMPKKQFLVDFVVVVLRKSTRSQVERRIRNDPMKA
jgi:hypothetical protein